MSKQTIDLGTAGQASGDSIRAAFDKVNDNFDEVYNLIENKEVYSGIYSGERTSTSTTYNYTPYFGDILPAGKYLFIFHCMCGARDTASPAGLQVSCSFPGIATSHAAINGDYSQTVCNLQFITLSSSTQVKAGIRRSSGSGTAKGAYFRWTAIRISDYNADEA